MPTTSTSTMFYLGNFADMDTNEGTTASENPNLVIGSHDTLQLVDITNHDQDDTGNIDTDNFGTVDSMSYDTGSGTVTTELDSVSTYNVSVLLGDGSTVSGSVVIIQTANGDAFVVDDNTRWLQLDNLDVQSMTVNYLVDSNFIGYENDQGVENASVVCFVAGTRIATPEGDIAVENLRPGMLVTTLDHGAQPVRWVNRTEHLKPGRNAPIILKPGSLGPGTPMRELRVSPQHRVLLRSPIVKRMCGTSQVLAAAKHMLPVSGITQALGFLPVRYHHFACANHEVVFANGAQVETFFAGEQALATLSETALQRLHDQVPLPTADDQPEPAKPFLEGKRLKQLVWRHQKNGRDLVEPYGVLNKSVKAA